MVDIPDEWLRSEVLKPHEVCEIFRIHPNTLSRWAVEGRIGCFRSPDGSRLYPIAEVRRLAHGDPAPDIVRELLEDDRFRKQWRPQWRNPHEAALAKREAAAKRETPDE